MKKTYLFENTEITEVLDDSGKVKEKRVVKKEFAKSYDTEPEYIKLYTDVWCTFYDVPVVYKELFLQLAMHMTPVDCNSLETSQLVYTTGPMRDYYIKSCGWKSYESMAKGLKALCECNAIKKIKNGIYQVNPSFAARGKWLDAKDGEDGKFTGLKSLRLTFDFLSGKMSTDVTYSEDDQ